MSNRYEKIAIIKTPKPCNQSIEVILVGQLKVVIKKNCLALLLRSHHYANKSNCFYLPGPFSIHLSYNHKPYPNHSLVVSEM